MKEYIIVSEGEMAVVEKRVGKLLNEGWKLAGGVSTCYKHEHATFGEHGHVPGHIEFSQALEKEG